MRPPSRLGRRRHRGVTGRRLAPQRSVTAIRVWGNFVPLDAPRCLPLRFAARSRRPSASVPAVKRFSSCTNLPLVRVLARGHNKEEQNEFEALHRPSCRMRTCGRLVRNAHSHRHTEMLRPHSDDRRHERTGSHSRYWPVRRNRRWTGARHRSELWRRRFRLRRAGSRHAHTQRRSRQGQWSARR